MAAFFLWCILFILCWPIALLALVLYPIVWLLTLPLRVLGIAVHGVLGLISALERPYLTPCGKPCGNCGFAVEIGTRFSVEPRYYPKDVPL